MPPGRLHIIVAGHQEKTCWSHWLFDLGLTNAEVHISQEVSCRIHALCLRALRIQQRCSPWA